MVTTTISPQIDWRQEWFEFEDATYLNLAGQSPLPRVSARAVQGALEAKKFPHHKTDATYFEVPNRTRENIARLVSAKPEEIALVKEASKRSKVTTSHFIRRSAVRVAELVTDRRIAP